MTYAKKILLLAMLSGSLIRLVALGQVPSGLYWDEAAIGADANSVLQTGKDMHGNSWFQSMYPSYGDFKMPIYILAVIPFTKLLGATATAVRLPSAIGGICLIGIIYLLGKELFNEKIGAYAALLMSWLPVDILFSRAGFEGHLAVVFLGISLWLWLISKKRPWLLLVSTIPMAIAVYTYFSARVVIPLAFVACSIYLFKSSKRAWRLLLLPTLLVWGMLIRPIFLSPDYPVSNQFRLSTQNVLNLDPYVQQANYLRGLWPNSVWARLLYHRRVLQMRAFLHNELIHFDLRYLFISGDANLRHSTQHVGLMLLAELPIFFIGMYWLLRKRTAQSLLLICLWALMILPAAVPLEVPHALRSLNVVLILPLLLGYGLGHIKLGKNWWGIALITFMMIESGLFVHDYFVHYPIRSADAWETSYTQLAEIMVDTNAARRGCQIAVPDKRLSLYLDFFMQLDPRTFEFDKNDYFARKMDNFIFDTTLPKSLANQCLVVNETQWHQLGEPAGTVIYLADHKSDLFILERL